MFIIHVKVIFTNFQLKTPHWNALISRDDKNYDNYFRFWCLNRLGWNSLTKYHREFIRQHHHIRYLFDDYFSQDVTKKQKIKKLFTWSSQKTYSTVSLRWVFVFFFKLRNSRQWASIWMPNKNLRGYQYYFNSIWPFRYKIEKKNGSVFTTQHS